MGRRIVAGAALVALMFAVSACKSQGANAPKPAVHTVTYSSPQPAAAPAAAKPVAQSSGGMHGKRRCMPEHDCTACYVSEADRDMGRLDDDLPDGGCCMPCGDFPCVHGGN